MGRIVLRCCCGSSIELRSWPSPEIEADAWHKVHSFCAIAWQHERGVKTSLKFPKDEDKEQA